MTLEFAGISSAGLKGRLKTKGLAALYLRCLRVWLDDDSADLSKTMAILDRSLTRAEKLAQFLDQPSLRQRFSEAARST